MPGAPPSTVHRWTCGKACAATSPGCAMPMTSESPRDTEKIMEEYKRFYEGKTVVITGGAGAIGSNLARAIGELNARTVVVFDDLSAAYRWNIPSLPNVLFVHGSVTDEGALKRVFVGKPDIVYHLAAFFANQNSVDYPQRDLQ